MKRSELKKKLADRIYKRLNDSSFSDIEDYTVIHELSCEMAEELLFLVEEQGMPPPLAGFVVDWDVEKIYWHKWEPEGNE